MTFFAIWGAFLSTVLAGIRVVEFFTKDRVRLYTSYAFRGHDSHDDEIVIANLSPVPVIVSSWELVWRPKLLWSKREPEDITPDFQDELNHFKVEGMGVYTMKFSGQHKVRWGHEIRDGRKLFLELRCFGRKRLVRLRIA